MRRLSLGLLIFASLFLLSLRFNTVFAQEDTSGGDTGVDTTGGGGTIPGGDGSTPDYVDAGNCSGCGSGNQVTSIESADSYSGSGAIGLISDVSVLGSDFATGDYLNISTGEVVHWDTIGGIDHNQCDDSSSQDCGGTGGGPIDTCCAPAPPPIAGWVIDENGKAISNAVVETNGVQATTGGDGKFSIDGVVSFGQGFSVRLNSVPQGYDYQSRKPDGNYGDMRWTYLHCNSDPRVCNRDTDPTIMQSYEFQVLGQDDCANATNDDRKIYGRCSFKVNTGGMNLSLKVVAADPAQSNPFNGKYGISGQTTGVGYNWINPMIVTATTDADSGRVKRIYVAFYDQASGSEITDKSTFLSQAQSRVSDTSKGFLVAYGSGIKSGDSGNNYYVWASGDWKNINGLEANGYKVSGMYTVYPYRADPGLIYVAWQVNLADVFKSKTMYTAIYTEDGVSSFLDPNATPTQ